MFAIELLGIHSREIIHSNIKVDVVHILVSIDAKTSPEVIAGSLIAQMELNAEDVPKRGLLEKGVLRQGLGATISTNA